MVWLLLLFWDGSEEGVVGEVFLRAAAVFSGLMPSHLLNTVNGIRRICLLRFAFNSEVKQYIADGSVGLPHARVGHRQALKYRKTLVASVAGVFLLAPVRAA